jgi:hypothetical protein
LNLTGKLLHVLRFRLTVAVGNGRDLGLRGEQGGAGFSCARLVSSRYS